MEIPKKDFENITIFCHGILSGVNESQRYKLIKKYLHKSGIATAAFYFPAHRYRQQEQCSLVVSEKTLEYAIDYIMETYPNKKITIVGVSLGSAAAMLLKQSYIKKIKALVVFSPILDPSVFMHFKFEKKHYIRWAQFGYTAKDAKKMFSSLDKENKLMKLDQKIKLNFKKSDIPKLIIHGLNDRVTNYKEVTKLIDQQTALLLYSGTEGTHDLKGVSLECASSHLANWISKK